MYITNFLAHKRCCNIQTFCQSKKKNRFTALGKFCQMGGLKSMGSGRDTRLKTSAQASLRPTHSTPPLPQRPPASSSAPCAAATSSPLAGRRIPHRTAAYFCPPEPPLRTRAGEQAAPRKMGWKAAEKLIRHWKVLRGDNVISRVLHSIPPSPSR